MYLEDVDEYVADEMEEKMKGWIEQLNRDLGCLTFVHVPKEELATHTTFANGILFVPATLTDGKCWSTLGVGNGFVGDWRQVIPAGITSLGAPATWQIISLSIPCYNERTVHHEGIDFQHSTEPYKSLFASKFRLKNRKKQNYNTY